jgi:hypothetical protein
MVRGKLWLSSSGKRISSWDFESCRVDIATLQLTRKQAYVYANCVNGTQISYPLHNADFAVDLTLIVTVMFIHEIQLWFAQNYWVFGLRPSSGILETRKHNVSETGSVSVLRLGEGRKHIRFPKRCVFKFLKYRTMGKVQKPSNSEYYTPSSEPFRINFELV